MHTHHKSTQLAAIILETIANIARHNSGLILSNMVLMSSSSRQAARTDLSALGVIVLFMPSTGLHYVFFSVIS